MSYYLYGVGAVVAVGVAVTVAGGGSSWDSAKATITTIDRKCQIIETKYDENYTRKESSTRSGDCNSVEEWEKVKAKHDKTIVGHAVVHVSYVAPQNGQSENGDLEFTPRENEFFDLRAGDEIKILVYKTDAARIRKT
jgi:hypothetical protein